MMAVIVCSTIDASQARVSSLSLRSVISRSTTA